MNKFIIFLLLLFVVGCFTSNDIVKYEYPHKDSVMVKYDVIYTNDNNDSSFYFSTLHAPIRILNKDTSWSTFFYSIDGKPILLKDGTYVIHKKYNKIIENLINEYDNEKKFKIEMK